MGALPGLAHHQCRLYAYHVLGRHREQARLGGCLCTHHEPRNGDQYLLDGRWQTLEQQEIALDVLIWGFIRGRLPKPSTARCMVR